MKKKEGVLEMFISCIFITLTVLIISFSLKMKELKVIKNFVEDGLVASNLASATIDLKEYGTNNKIINNNFLSSFDVFATSLKDNLNLDGNYQSKDARLIRGKVNIDNFTIYNVDGNNVYVTTKNSGGINTYSIQGGVGNTKTPDGVVIKSTTIYSKISFHVKGLKNDDYLVSREKSVDITNKD